MASSWDQAWGPDPLAEEAPPRCEGCHDPIFYGETCIKMDGLVFCGAECAMEEEACEDCGGAGERSHYDQQSASDVMIVCGCRS
jgi:hypothetical protein